MSLWQGNVPRARESTHQLWRSERTQRVLHHALRVNLKELAARSAPSARMLIHMLETGHCAHTVLGHGARACHHRESLKALLDSYKRYACTTHLGHQLAVDYFHNETIHSDSRRNLPYAEKVKNQGNELE